MDDRGRFLTAEWRWLLMVNWTVDPAVLAPRVPAGTTLDLFEGRALASLVAFRFLRTRVLGVPVPWHVDFDEVNLRFYVKHVTPAGEVRRAATFVRELVPRRAIAWLARLAYNEPYDAVPMWSSIPMGAETTMRGDDGAPPVVRTTHVDPYEPGMPVGFGWRAHGREHRVAATLRGTPVLPPAGSEEAFVAEHYWGYTRQRDGGTVEYRVRHAPWRVCPATLDLFDVDVERLYGRAFVPALSAPPSSVFVAEGSPVQVDRPRRL